MVVKFIPYWEALRRFTKAQKGPVSCRRGSPCELQKI